MGYSYRKVIFPKTTLKGVERWEGEWLQTKIRRMMEQEESIDEISARIYTEKKDGVLPDYNIRTDRWEYATDAMDKVHANNIAKSMPKGPHDEEGSNIESSKGNPIGGAEAGGDSDG